MNELHTALEEIDGAGEKGKEGGVNGNCLLASCTYVPPLQLEKQRCRNDWERLF